MDGKWALISLVMPTVVTVLYWKYDWKLAITIKSVIRTDKIVIIAQEHLEALKSVLLICVIPAIDVNP